MYNQNSGPARPIAYGIFQALCKDGRPAPFARITVTYSGTPTLAAIYSHPSAAPQYLMPNPATADHRGRVPLYFRGGPVDVLVEDEGGCEVDFFTNYGGYVDGDFNLEDSEIKECVDIPNPLLRIYDADRCNIPDSLTSPEHVIMWANWKTGLPIATYSKTVEFFECIGETFPCNIVVYGDDNGKRYRYNCTDCNVAVPPNPEEVDFDCTGLSECWTDINLFDVAQLAGQTSAFARWKADEPLPNSTHSLLYFDESGGDPVFFDDSEPDAFIIPADGPYIIGGGAGFQASAANASWIQIALVVNGDFANPILLSMIEKTNANIVDMHLAGTWADNFTEGDILRFYFRATYSGGSDARYPSVDFLSDGFSAWIQRVAETCT